MDEQSKLKFDLLYESVVNTPPESLDIIEERNFNKKTNPAKTKHPNRPKTRKTEHKRKLKLSKDDRPIEHQRPDMKMSRGQQRKRQNFVPMYRSIKSATELPTAKKVLIIAKKATSGIWKLTGTQVIEIASKYHFNIPGPTQRVRHLGSTGILMWRKGPKDYYLVKLGKHQKDRTRYT